MRKPIQYLAAAVSAGLLLTGCAFGPPKEPGGITMLDSTGNVLVSGADATSLSAHQNWAYLEQAAYEGAKILEEKLALSWEDAQQALFSGSYTLHTALDPTVCQCLQDVLQNNENTAAVAGAITDLQGRLLALYSTRDGDTNHATQTKHPCSAFKSLSVYTPALEAGKISWVSQVEDSPYLQIDGKDWPQNNSGIYAKKNVMVYDAIRKSLNTVAVKVLADVGVEESIAFLQDSFGMTLGREAALAKEKGGDEVIGNVALGSLEVGVSPMDMAGYYQIFANGGKYQKPAAVLEVTDTDGNTIYTRSDQAKRVVKAETADLMNRLLQGVVTVGATGEEAAVPGVPIAGKTGTGNEGSDNWFVGVTGAYSCAIWHGQNQNNRADVLFSQVTKAIYELAPQTEKVFLTHGNMRSALYCTQSGKAAGKSCPSVGNGYFAGLEPLPACDIHQ